MIRWLFGRLKGRTIVAETKDVCVGIRSDGSIDLDLCDEGSDGWDCHNLTIKDAEFIVEHLNDAVTRARIVAQKRPKVDDEDDTLQPDP